MQCMHDTHVSYVHMCSMFHVYICTVGIVKIDDDIQNAFLTCVCGANRKVSSENRKASSENWEVSWIYRVLAL